MNPCEYTVKDDERSFQMVQRGEAYFIVYTVTDQNGDTIFSNEGGKPIEILSGHSQVLPEVEKRIASLEVGQTIQFTLSPNQAYGTYQTRNVKQKKIKRLRYDGDLSVGSKIKVWRWWGEQTLALVRELDTQAGLVTLDFNHEHVDKTLSYSITLAGKEELPPVIG